MTISKKRLDKKKGNTAWNGKLRGGILGYKIFFWFLKNIGIRAANFLLFFVASSFFIFLLPKNPLWKYYHKRLGFNWIKSFFYIFMSYNSMGKSMIDRFAMFLGKGDKYSFVFEGEDYLFDMAENTGGIMLSGHLGNWEIAGFLLKRLKTPVNIIMFDNEVQEKKDLFEKNKYAKNDNLNIIYVKKDSLDHMFEIDAVLKRKELLILHGDRVMEGIKSAKCEFLGKEANFPLGPYIFAQKYQVPICYVFAMKKRIFNYHFVASKPIYIDKEEKRGERIKINKELNNYVEQLEKMTKKYPNQWYNFYDFWNDKK